MDDRFQTALKAEGLSVFMKQIPQLGGARASPQGLMGAGGGIRLRAAAGAPRWAVGAVQGDPAHR